MRPATHADCIKAVAEVVFRNTRDKEDTASLAAMLLWSLAFDVVSASGEIPTPERVLDAIHATVREARDGAAAALAKITVEKARSHGK